MAGDCPQCQERPARPCKNPGGTISSRALIDPCRPFERCDEFPPVAESSPERKQKTQEKISWNLDKT